MAGIYLHIPFCKRFCNYCDFYSTNRLSKKRPFLEALKIEIRERASELESSWGEVQTLYFGGGTPSLLTPQELTQLLEEIANHYPLAEDKEITIELNPDDFNLSYGKALKEIGFNRLSIGVQSLYEPHLIWMNRRHSADEAIEAIVGAKRVGFDNLSVDLIFGFETLTTKILEENLSQILSLAPQHLSIYQLGVESGTKLYREFLSGEYSPLSDESCWEQYRVIQKRAKEWGYLQYEISNFAFKGRESRHNSSYWEFTPYLGFGPSAHSYNRVERLWNSRGIKRYIEGIERGERSYHFERLTARDHFNEKIMLSLRRVKGFKRADIEPPTNSNFWEIVDSLMESGLLIEEQGEIKIPPEKLFISDGIISRLFI